MRGYSPVLTTKKIFIVSLLVAALTIIAVWLFRLGQHRSLFQNSILSTTILSVAFFLFLAIGLYKGIRLKENLGKITDRIKIDKRPDLSNGFEFPADFIVAGEGIAGIIIGIIIWLLFAVLLIVLVWFFSTVIWMMVLVFAAMLYWVFFRALRLVFKNANKCKNNLRLSIAYGLAYTILYNFWIYGIILASNYLVK